MNLSDLEAAFIIHTQQGLEKRNDPRVYIEHPFALAKRLAGFREIGQKMDQDKRAKLYADEDQLDDLRFQLGLVPGLSQTYREAAE